MTDTPIFSTCACQDPHTQMMRDLITAGIPQWDASLIAFGNPPTDAAGPATWSTWVRIEVRRIANEARQALGLRLLPTHPTAVL